MADDGRDTTTTTDEQEFDFAHAADSIGAADLGLSVADTTPTPEDETPEAATTVAEETPAPVVTQTPAPRTAPKTWPKEMHPHWDKTPKEVQDYWETSEKQMLDGLTQYKDAATFAKTIHDIGQEFKEDLEFNKADIPTALRFLLHANRQLTTGPSENRIAAYRDLGKRLGLADGESQTEEATIDPTIKRLQDEIYQIKSGLTAQQQAQYTAAKTQVSQEVEAFASDPAHAYFDEVSEDMVRLIHTGLPLQEAYEKSVWANPVTRAKEITRVQTEHEVKLKENARLQALPKRKAAGVNVRGQETQRAPTDPLGSMEDTIRETLVSQRTRVS